jgi:hypothetical protein
MASVLISEVEPDVRRLLVLLVERRGHAAIALDANVVVPPRADVLLVDPVAPASVEHARLARSLFPELAVVCLNPLPNAAAFLGGAPDVLPAEALRTGSARRRAGARPRRVLTGLKTGPPVCE